MRAERTEVAGGCLNLAKDDAMGSGGGPRRSRGGPAEDAEPGRRDLRLPTAAGAARGRVSMELAPSGSVRYDKAAWFQDLRRRRVPDGRDPTGMR